jgi:hypothetical protein
MNARFSNFPSQRTRRSSLNECSQRKSVLRVTPAAMIRLSRSQSPFRESRDAKPKGEVRLSKIAHARCALVEEAKPRGSAAHSGS